MALEDLTEIVHGGDLVIIDGNRGIVIVNPDEETIRQYEAYGREFIALEHKLDAIREEPAVTRDGVRVTLLGNIEFPDEAQQVLDKGGEGIGLYRTEFLYLNRPTEPTEQEHYEAYATTVRIMGQRPVVIRTVDLGADKYTQRRRYVPEPNPFLGLRSIRYCLQNLTMFKTQLRAILRASVLGQVKVMFPLITNIQELMQAKMILHDVMEDLDEEGIKYNRDMKVGIMVETPSAALTASTPGPRVGFLQHRDERPDAVHAGGGPGQRAGLDPVLGGGPRRASPDPNGDPGRLQGEDRRLRLRGDRLRAGVCHAAARHGDSHALAFGADDSGDQADDPLGHHRGVQRPGPNGAGDELRETDLRVPAKRARKILPEVF